MNWERIYAKQEYLTPGAASTVEMIEEICQPAATSWILEVASGKGEAACTLVERHRCQVLCVDIYSPWFEYVADKVQQRGLSGHVTLVRADGKHLPLHAGCFDVSFCIGAPSIVGLEPCLRELARATRIGGWVVVSDIVWRRRVGRLEAGEWGELAEVLAEVAEISAAEYVALMGAVGLEVVASRTYDTSAWDEYLRPIREVIEETRRLCANDPSALAWADENERAVDVERRAAEQFLDYATFIGRKG